MAEVQKKSFNQPDYVQTFPNGSTREVQVGTFEVGLVHHDPGWRWSTDARPIVGTERCEVHHVGVVLSGRVCVEYADGRTFEFQKDDVFDMPPGHDSWVLGDEAFETIEWIGVHGWASPSAGDRVLATLVFTDIVGSTARAGELGDRAWRRLLHDHHALIRTTLERFRGREVETTGDGILAIFDGAERAVRAAVAMAGAVRSLDLTIRTGIHTGEVELVAGRAEGIAVHIAARILALAEPDEILISDTTRGLIESPDLVFVDRGRHALRGVTGERAVYSLQRGERATV